MFPLSGGRAQPDSDTMIYYATDIVRAQSSSSWAPSFGSLSGRRQLGGDPEVDPGLAGGIT